MVWGWRLSGRKFQRFIGTTVHMGVPGVPVVLQRGLGLEGLIRLCGWFRSVVASPMLRVVLLVCGAVRFQTAPLHDGIGVAAVACSCFLQGSGVRMMELSF